MEKAHKNGNVLLDKYYPQHPLPKEIKDLPETETVCEFCGISYLIHSEIKRLEEEIISLNKKIKNLQESKINEKKYEHKCQNLLNQLEQCNLKCLSLEESAFQLKTERDLLKNTVTEKEDLLITMQSSVQIWKADKNKLTEKRKQIFQYLFDLKQANRDLKDQLLADKSEIELNMSNERMKNQFAIANIASLIERIKETNHSEVDLYEKKLKIQNLEISKLQDEVKKKKNELLEESEKFAVIEDKNRKLLEENNKLEHKIQEQSLVITQKDDVIKLTTDSNHAMRSSKMADMNNIKSEMASLKKENQNLEDLLDQERKLKISLNAELESALGRLNGVSNIKENLEKQISLHEVENQTLLKKLEEIYENNQSTLKDRDKQIINLKEQISELLLQLKSIQQLSQDSQTKLEATFNLKSKVYEREIANQTNELQVLKEKLKVVEMENVNLEKMLIQCKNDNQEIQKQNDEFVRQKNQQNFENEETQNKIIQELENEIMDKEKIIDRMEEDLIRNNNEISSLKQMVQQECEERYELTESLNRAREQLLMIGEFSISKNPISLPPIPPRNSSSSTVSAKTNSSQNSQKSLFQDKQNSSISQRKNSKNSLISTKRKLERLFNE